MPHTYLCFVWHMHQPFYKDLATGEYQLPWTRMHALKDYYGMVQILKETPSVHQTFNLVPSMMVQIAEYACGDAHDPFLRAAAKPAEDLSAGEQDFILRYFFQANPSKVIGRYPRYAELHDAWRAAAASPSRLKRIFTPAALRDLQVLSQLAWFDEEFIDHDPEVQALVLQARDFTLEHQKIMVRKQREIIAKVLPVYKSFAASGQIEISTTPYYHPILPLLCDSEIATVSHPYVPLPSRFRYPQDAQHQIETAREYIAAQFGRVPNGLWPSEGSVSDAALSLAAAAGFRWTATDNGVLSATLHRMAGPDDTYRPYLWRHAGQEIHVLFRDHFLSDLIGFVYSRMEPLTAAQHFLDRIRENCAPILASGRDAVVPVILDGENAWEHFDRNGRPFLRELYRRIADSPDLDALTVSEMLDRVQPTVIDHIFPGSWINSNFDVWIGAEEDNRAWDLLLRARQTYELILASPDAAALSPEAKRLAYEELLIAEGSDWCWWYGPEHHSDNRPEFDKLFREHLSHFYRVLNLVPPEELSRPILKIHAKAFQEEPSSPIKPTIDGEVTSYFEWLGAGLFVPERRSGAMHGQRFAVRELHYGSDGRNLYLRLDLDKPVSEVGGVWEIAATIAGGPQPAVARFRLGPDSATLVEATLPNGASAAEAFQCAYRKIFEARIRLASLGVTAGQPVRVQLSVWQNGLPVDAVPVEGWLAVSTADPSR